MFGFFVLLCRGFKLVIFVHLNVLCRSLGVCILVLWDFPCVPSSLVGCLFGVWEVGCRQYVLF